MAALAEKIDTSVVDTSKMPKGLVSDCAVPSMTYSYVLMYNTKTYGANPPKGWADFFDTKKFPGKRALQNAPQGGGYEVALLADGVAPGQLYPLNYDRAFAKAVSAGVEPEHHRVRRLHGPQGSQEQGRRDGGPPTPTRRPRSGRTG